MSNLIEISTTTNHTIANALADYLTEIDALAVTLTDAKDEPLFQLEPDDEPLWSRTTVTALFHADTHVKQLLSQIKNDTDFSGLDFSIKPIIDQNWVAETQKLFHAQAFHQLWVCPAWEKNDFLKKHPDAKKTLFIEPGLAFGTGTHPTTQLCLTWLADNKLKDKTVIDYGCGSGILALAALALDAALVYATDHDPLALDATHNNLAHNTFDPNRLDVRTTHNMANCKADIIIANILANPLITLAPTLTQFMHKNSILVLSGLLIEDVDRVIAAYAPTCRQVDTKIQADWALLTLRLG